MSVAFPSANDSSSSSESIAPRYLDDEAASRTPAQTPEESATPACTGRGTGADEGVDGAGEAGAGARAGVGVGVGVGAGGLACAGVLARSWAGAGVRFFLPGHSRPERPLCP